MTMKRLSLLLVALAFALGAPGHARADEGVPSGDNAAVAVNTKDGSSLFKLAFSLRRVAGDVVDNENAAVAYSSCESCRTTAIAIQIVLVVGSPSTVTPKNFAVAINDGCTLCQTFAAAFQFVIGVDDPSVGFTKEGMRELHRILREFKALKKDDYTLEEFHARTQALSERLRVLLETQLVPHGRGGADDPGDELDEETRPAPPPAPHTTTSGGTTAGATTAPAGTTTAPSSTTTAPATTAAPPPTTDTTTTTTTTTTEPPPGTTAPPP
jgi:putative peptide zinc metalloprotease protein